MANYFQKFYILNHCNGNAFLWDTETPFFIDLKQLDNYGRTLIQDTCHQYANLNITEIWDVGGIDLSL